jgi:hypothetical protein
MSHFPSPDDAQDGGGLSWAGRLDPSARAQLPGTIWTTDARLVLTFAQSPLFAQLGIPADRLIGQSLTDLLSDGETEHPLIDRHRDALEGEHAPIAIPWGRYTISGIVGPLRDREGAIVGCIGAAVAAASEQPGEDLALEYLIEQTRRERVVDGCRHVIRQAQSFEQAAPHLLALICHDLDWKRATLWTVDATDRLTCVGRYRLDPAGAAALEPFAWLAATSGAPATTDELSGCAVPLRANGRTVGVLGLIGDLEGDSADRLAALGPLAGALARSMAGDEPRTRLGRLLRTVDGAVRFRLAACLCPLPFIFTAC